MKKQNIPAILAGIGLVALILDTKTALSGAADGIALCIQTLIPSVFPFLFLSGFLTSSLLGKNIIFLRPVGKILHIPSGAESIFLIGLLGGYPIGARCVADAVGSGCISQENGNRMLAFCSNAGPAFLFGIGSRFFSDIRICWMLWAIHIAAALLAGCLTPGGNQDTVKLHSQRIPAASTVLRNALQTMATICGWVILFRVLLAFCQRWFLWLLPVWGQNLITGCLELANGCCNLVQIEDEKLRIVLCSVMLGFGGLCVTMQTFSVCTNMDCSWYLPGKLLQAFISLCMACMAISREMALPCAIVLVTLIATLLFFQHRTEKKNSNLRKCIV